MDPKLKNYIVEDAKEFFASESWYAERGLPFRRGVSHRALFFSCDPSWKQKVSNNIHNWCCTTFALTLLAIISSCCCTDHQEQERLHLFTPWLASWDSTSTWSTCLARTWRTIRSRSWSQIRHRVAYYWSRMWMRRLFKERPRMLLKESPSRDCWTLSMVFLLRKGECFAWLPSMHSPPPPLFVQQKKKRGSNIAPSHFMSILVCIEELTYGHWLHFSFARLIIF